MNEIDEERSVEFSIEYYSSPELTRFVLVSADRRLLYVAITRAQSFCFISYANSRMAGGVLTLIGQFVESKS